MKYVHLHGLTVSQLCLGTWYLPASSVIDGNGITEVDSRKSTQLIRRAFDLGINFFDTANTYHGRIQKPQLYPEYAGNSERVLGESLSGYERESFVVSTKVRADMARFPNGGGLSRKHIRWQIGESLKRLGMKYVDIYQPHWEDRSTPHLETMGALNDLVRSGFVQYIGVSNHSPESIEHMQQIAGDRGYEQFILLQERYNLTNREIEKGKIPLARKYGMDLLAYEPLAQGLLSGKWDEGGTRERLSGNPKLQEYASTRKDIVVRVQEAARQMQITPAQLSIAWILRMQRSLGVSIVPIIGATSIEHLEENVAAVDIDIPEDVFKSLVP